MSTKIESKVRPNPATATEIISQKDRKVKGIQSLAKSEKQLSSFLARTTGKNGQKYAGKITETKIVDENGVEKIGKTVSFFKKEDGPARNISDAIRRQKAFKDYIRETGGKKPLRHVFISYDRKNRETGERYPEGKCPVFISIDGGERMPIQNKHYMMFGIES